MAIIDGIEVFVKLSGVQRILLEYRNQAPFPFSPPLPWAKDCQTACQYINGVEGQLFEVFIRMIDEETNAGGADGIHISIKAGEGEVINHFYSAKFSELQRDENNRLFLTIRSVVQRTQTGYNNVLFAFGTSSRASPLTVLDLANPIQPLDGFLDITIIKVTHLNTPLRYAPVTSERTSFQPYGFDPNFNPHALIPIAIDAVHAPVVYEQVIAAPPPFGDGHRFVFFYRNMKSPEIELICR